MRVGFVCEFPTFSGGERALADLAARLPAYGLTPVCLAPGGGALAREFARRGLLRHDFDLGEFKAEGSRFRARAADALLTLRSHLGLDILHANSLSVARTVGVAAQQGGLDTVAHVRDIRRLNPSWVAQITGNRLLVAVSDAVRRSLLEAGVPADRIELLADGVDASRFEPALPRGVLRAELGLPPDAFLIGSIGQISVRKGQRVLLRALLAALPRIPGGAAVIVGERFSTLTANREYERDVRRMADDPRVRGHIHFLGFREGIESVIQDLDLIVHTAHQEPLSLVLLEAAALGKPVVATRVGGTEEIVRNGVTGVLVERGDDQAIARAILRLHADPAARARMGARARTRCRERFDLDRVAKRLAWLHHRIAGRGGPG